MATKWNFLANSLKIFSSETADRILKLFHRICSLGDPFQKLIVKFWFVKTCGSGEWGATCTIQKSRNSLKIFSSETAGRILELFHRYVPWVTLFKNCSWNFDPSKNVALVNGGYLHYTEIKEFFKNLLLWNRWSDFEIISQGCSLGDPFQNSFGNFDPSKNVALVNGGYLHYTEMKEFLKNLLLWNRWSDFEIISQSCSLGDPFQKLFAKFWLVKKHGSGEWGLLAQ